MRPSGLLEVKKQDARIFAPVSFSSAFPPFYPFETSVSAFRIFLPLASFPLASYGGDEEDRTPDPLRARQVLSQLSYTPVFSGFRNASCFPIFSKY